MDTLMSVGLGYVKLGQSALTLSGGEAQRVKLALELSRRSTGKTLYILDEPTTGLHFVDVKQLMEVIQRLVDQGNTVIMIEHNLDVLLQADHIIDLGPEGGDRGGELIVSGTPEEVAEWGSSYTGQYLKDLMEQRTKTSQRLERNRQKRNAARRK
jgi:excinuclease ABC subunit A